MAQEKMYVLDTNVLVHDPGALSAFEGVLVGIPSVVLEEIDSFKREPSERGRNTREVIRQLDLLRERGSLQKGVALDNGAHVRVLFLGKDDPLKLPFRMNVADNEILLTALAFKEKGYDVRFISKDLNARVKGDALGLKTEDYLNERVSEDKFYKGWVDIAVPAVELKKDVPANIDELLVDHTLEINEYVLMHSQHNPHNYRVSCYKGRDKFIPVYPPKFKWPIKPKNPQQLMALDALLDDSIQFVVLFGPAGTGKTFLALLAALHKVLTDEAYKKILISRPVVPLGKDIGYLPGTIEEKLQSWMLPIHDNIDLILHNMQKSKHLQDVKQDYEHKGRYKKGFHPRERRERGSFGTIDELVRRDKLSLEAITYMRGRSIPFQYIIIDEVQNLSPHEVKTLVSRVGEGSKIVLTGDPYQIDSPYLDFNSNGLVVTSEKFKGQKIFSTIYLETSERSELSQLANDLL